MILPSISCLNDGDLSSFQMIISLSTTYNSQQRTDHGTTTTSFNYKGNFLFIILQRALLLAWFSFYLLLMEIVSKLNHKLHRARIKELNGNGNTSKCLSSALYLKLRPELKEIPQKHLKALHLKRVLIYD